MENKVEFVEDKPKHLTKPKATETYDKRWVDIFCQVNGKDGIVPCGICKNDLGIVNSQQNFYTGISTKNEPNLLVCGLCKTFAEGLPKPRKYSNYLWTAHRLTAGYMYDFHREELKKITPEKQLTVKEKVRDIIRGQDYMLLKTLSDNELADLENLCVSDEPRILTNQCSKLIQKSYLWAYNQIKIEQNRRIKK